MAELTIRDVFNEKPADTGGTELFEQWKADPTPQQMRGVIGGLDDVISKAVTQYGGPKAPPSLRHHARVLAARAVKSYDPSIGANLKTHVFRQLQALQRKAPQISDPFTPAERFRRQQAEIYKATELFKDTMGREPTSDELADVTGLPQKRVDKVRARMRPRIPFSAYEDSFGDDDEGETPEIVSEERTEFDDWTEAVYHDLGPVDKLIMQHRTGYTGADILDNISLANKLGVTPAAVSQRAKRIQRRLDEFYG